MHATTYIYKPQDPFGPSQQKLAESHGPHLSKQLGAFEGPKLIQHIYIYMHIYTYIYYIYNKTVGIADII
jgi:hypothetical protein